MVTKNRFDKQAKEIAVKTVLRFDDDGHYCAINYAELYDTILSSGHIEYKGKVFLPCQYLVNLPEAEVIGQMQFTMQQIQLALEAKKGIQIRGTDLSVPKKSFFEWVVDLSALGLLGVITSLFIIFD